MKIEVSVGFVKGVSLGRDLYVKEKEEETEEEEE